MSTAPKFNAGEARGEGQEKAEQWAAQSAHDTAQNAAQSAKQSAEHTGGLMQQAGEQMMGMAYDAAEAIKKAVGIGSNNNSTTNKTNSTTKY
ncbi:hypothetical protein M5K25_010366 [Dendrobium thyrsiflorum]|uniref:Uncharacterized protein n=1 Tax=Dendrobium thyrsiflorum TaxID=117978 RepID=A0ABD0UZW7_DENTH